eukprot:258345-Chlamydomonas_euryale.AAC.5
MIWRSASARLAAFSASRLVVGSSSARMPQLRQNASASASRMIRQASTWVMGGTQEHDQASKHLGDGRHTGA